MVGLKTVTRLGINRGGTLIRSPGFNQIKKKKQKNEKSITNSQKRAESERADWWEPSRELKAPS